jgi:hypothetical protein
MKGPLDDELDAGGTTKSVPYPGVPRIPKEQFVWKMFYLMYRPEMVLYKRKREEPKLLPFQLQLL